MATAVLLLAQPRSEAVRAATPWLLAALLFLLPQAVLLATRPAQAPVQDGLLVTEAAARRLLAGHDPYGHDYLDDVALRAFYLPEFPVNPLLAHFPYPPGLLLLAVPFAAAGIPFGWAWLVGLPALAGSAWLAAGRSGVVAAALSPLLLLDHLTLFNDLFFLAAGIGGLVLIGRRRALAGGLLVGLALLLKQTAIVLLPAALFLSWRCLEGLRRAVPALAAAALALAVSAPFAAWDAGAFLRDTGSYFYGSGVDSFPIRGFGLPGLLLAAGLIPGRWASYPAAAAQAVVLLPVLYLALRRLRERFSWTELWAWSGAVAAAVFLFGRTLAPNYVTVAAVLFGLALASELERPPPAAVRAPDQHP